MHQNPALILAGRGAIFRTTAQLAAQMDFELHLASPDLEDLASLESAQPHNPAVDDDTERRD